MRGRSRMRMTAAIAVLYLATTGIVAAQQETGTAETAAASASPSSATPAPTSDTQAQKVETPPQPMHTGVSAIVRTLGSDFAAFPRRQSTWVILGIGGGLAALAHPIDQEFNARLAGSPAVGRFFAPGKVIGSTWVQVGTATGLYVAGRYLMPAIHPGTPRTNRVSHLGYDLLRAQIVTQALVQGVKQTVRRPRPTGECCSFPSGHAAAAFATASVLERHFGYRAALPTMAVATYVAASRLHDNRHFLSDVAFGSALGMATGWTIVGRHGRSAYALLPVPVHGGVELTIIQIARPAREAGTRDAVAFRER
jgi:membrane-associated phospholipid phosphatase